MVEYRISQIIKFEDVYWWLHHFEKSKLDSVIAYQVELLNKHIFQREFTDAWHVLNRLLTKVKSIEGEMGKAEVLLECGKGAYELGDFQKAALYLENAHIRYAWRMHPVAVTEPKRPKML